MTITGTLKLDKRSPLAGKPYSFDLGLDVVHISINAKNVAFSDYHPIPDKGPFKDRYLIVDFDKDQRVVGFTAEGLLEDYRHTSVWARVQVDFGILVLRHISAQVTETILDYIKDQIPALDANGGLAGGSHAFA